MKRQNLRTVSLIVVTFTYLLIGAAIFGYLESEYEVRQRETLELIELIVKRKYNISDDDFTVLTTTVIKSVPHKAGIQWKFPGAFYFATTVVTTIGYGHSTPATTAGRSFCMIYALIGIPLGLVMFQSIGERLNTFVGSALSYAKRCAKAKNPEVTQTNLVMVVLVLSTILMTSMAAVFAKYERWDYFDALYYCFITLTTIGFGDYVALQKESALQSKPEYVALSLIFILFGLSVVSSAVNLLVLKFLTLNTEDERRDEQLRYTANLNSIQLEGDVITSAANQTPLALGAYPSCALAAPTSDGPPNGPAWTGRPAKAPASASSGTRWTSDEADDDRGHHYERHDCQHDHHGHQGGDDHCDRDDHADDDDDDEEEIEEDENECDEEVDEEGESEVERDFDCDQQHLSEHDNDTSEDQRLYDPHDSQSYKRTKHTDDPVSDDTSAVSLVRSHSRPLMHLSHNLHNRNNLHRHFHHPHLESLGRAYPPAHPVSHPHPHSHAALNPYQHQRPRPHLYPRAQLQTHPHARLQHQAQMQLLPPGKLQQHYLRMQQQPHLNPKSFRQRHAQPSSQRSPMGAGRSWSRLSVAQADQLTVASSCTCSHPSLASALPDTPNPRWSADAEAVARQRPKRQRLVCRCCCEHPECISRAIQRSSSLQRGRRRAETRERTLEEPITSSTTEEAHKCQQRTEIFSIESSSAPNKQLPAGRPGGADEAEQTSESPQVVVPAGEHSD